MNISDLLNADRWIKLAFRNVVVLLCILLFVSLAVRTPFGPFVALGTFSYIIYRISTVRPERNAGPRQRNRAGAERTPVLPGEARQ
jgi:uncharacterized membrane protein